MAHFKGNYAGLAQSVHDTLVQACYAHPRYNYKNGAFATSITSSRPVLSCLDVLISSPLTSPSETAVFQDLGQFLTIMKAKGARAKVKSQDIIAQASLFMDRFPDVFRNDQRARGIKPAPDSVIAVFPKGYRDEDLHDHVKLLLAITVQAVILGCDSGYKNGIFRSLFTATTSIIVMLGLPARDPRLTEAERVVFANAGAGAKRLLGLQMKGITVVEPYTMMYVEHQAWFKPVLAVFERDCEARGVPTPKFRWYTFFPVFEDSEYEFQSDSVAAFYDDLGSGLAVTSAVGEGTRPVHVVDTGVCSVGPALPTGEAWSRNKGITVTWNAAAREKMSALLSRDNHGS